MASQLALVVKSPSANAGDTGDSGSIPGSGTSPGKGNGIPLQYSCLDNPMDRAAWWATVYRVAKSWTTGTQACTIDLLIVENMNEVLTHAIHECWKHPTWKKSYRGVHPEHTHLMCFNSIKVVKMRESLMNSSRKTKLDENGKRYFHALGQVVKVEVG